MRYVDWVVHVWAQVFLLLHPSTHPPIPCIQQLIPTASFSSIQLTHPPTQTVLSLIVDKGKKMRYVDWVVHVWAQVTMRFIGYVPRVEGVENLPPMDETVMYVPNHTSFLDILTLSGFIKRPFKYISKIEILR